jgi:hypothetical protein
MHLEYCRVKQSAKPNRQIRVIGQKLEELVMLNKMLMSVAVAGISNMALAESPVLVQAPVEKVFVPAGFDDNDKVEVIVHGHFNSSCYKMGPVSASVDETNKKVTLNAQAFYYPGATCIQMVTPFIKSIELDRHLTSGSYTIAVADRQGVETSQLRVAKSTRPDADDYLYAAVNSVSVESGVDGAREIVLKGQHPDCSDGCVKFDDVKSYVGGDKTIVVQPITKIVYGDECRGSVNNRFEYRAKFGGDLSQGEYLLHVRALDGNAINQFLKLD